MARFEKGRKAPNKVYVDELEVRRLYLDEKLNGGEISARMLVSKKVIYRVLKSIGITRGRSESQLIDVPNRDIRSHKNSRLSSSGYEMTCIEKDSPYISMASISGKTYYAPIGRIVMARHLGRCLEKWEHVRHRNGDKTDDRIENLSLCSIPSGVDKYGNRVCPGCGRNKNENDFYKVKNRKDGIGKYCKNCIRDKARESHLLSDYDMTLDEYKNILSSQGGVCAICGEIGSLKKSLCVDHNHKTNKVRALLCFNCNSLIGFSMENTGILEKAIAYLGFWKDK